MNNKKFICFMLSASLCCSGAAVQAAEALSSTETAPEDPGSDVVSDNPEVSPEITDPSVTTDSEGTSESSESWEPWEPSESSESSDTETEGSESIDTEEIVETEVTEEAETVNDIYTDMSTYSSYEAKQICFNYLTTTGGLNAAQACGVMANIQEETGYLANNVGDVWEKSHGYTDATFTAAVDNGTYTRDEFIYDYNGYGLCQWMYWSAKRDLYDYAKSAGTSIGNLYMQLGFLSSTIRSDTDCWNYMKDIPNTLEGAYTAGWNFCEHYERPGNMSYYGPKRGGIAQSLWQEFCGGSTDTGNTDTGESTGSSTDSSTTSYSTGTYTITASTLMVRQGNSTSYNSIGYLSKGTQVKVLEVTSNGWGKIVYNGQNGWISLTYCSLDSADSAESTTTTTTEKATTTTTEALPSTDGNEDTNTLYQITASSLNVRSGAGTNYSVIGYLQKGEQVNVTGTSGSWYKISYNGTTGYISSTYCQKVTSSETVTTDTTKAPVTVEPTTTTTTEAPKATTTTTTAADKKTETTTETVSSLGVYTVTASSLTVRKGTSTSYASLGTLPKGTQVTVLKQVNGWGMINYNGQTGYVYMYYLQQVTPAVTTTTTEKAVTTTTEKATTTTTEAALVTTTSGQTISSNGAIYTVQTLLNVRSGPGTSYSVLGTLEQNRQITVYSITDNWAKITFNDQTAYVSAKYLTYVGEVSHTCTYDSGVIVTPATCIDTGLITYTCTTCGETKDEVLPIDPNNHTGKTKVENVIDATYDNKGYTGDTYCDSCGVLLEKGTETPLLQFAITKQPTSVVVAKEGYYATIKVEATGEELTYKWYWKMPSDTAYKLSTVTTNTYRYAVTASRNGRQVYCLITDKNGNTLKTDVVTMSYKE